MNRTFPYHRWTGIGLLLIALLAGTPALAQENPEATRLSQRLYALDGNPDHASLGAFERLQAGQAIEQLGKARRGEIATALQVAQWRVEIAELAVQTELIRRQIEAVEREHGQLLLEASRREAARARQEAERLRTQAQIQAEEAARLRRAVEAEARARQEAEGVLDSVASDQVERARAARQRAAELRAQEDALRRRLQQEE